MSAVDERTAIGTLFNAEWDSDTTPIAWPNRNFTPPQNNSWVRLSILQGEPFQIEIGSANCNQHRSPGFVMISVFSPMNKGDAAALALAETAAQIFRSTKRVSAGANGDIRFRTPEVKAIGIDSKGSRDLDEGTYYQVNVSVPFVRDDVF